MSKDRNYFLLCLMAFLILGLSPAVRAEQIKSADGKAPAGARDFTPPAAEEAKAAADAVEEEPLAEDENAALDEETEYSYGTIANVGDGALQVKEYDYDSGADVSVDYTVDAAAKYEGANSLKDVAVGDNVEMDYLEKDGKRVIVSMSVEKPFTEEEKSTALANEGQADKPKEDPAAVTAAETGTQAG